MSFLDLVMLSLMLFIVVCLSLFLGFVALVCTILTDQEKKEIKKRLKDAK